MVVPLIPGRQKKNTKMNGASLVLLLAVLSTQAAQHRQKRSSNYYVYCPTGEKKLVLSASDISEGNVRAKFEKYCQCDYDKVRTKYKHKWNYGYVNYGCSAGIVGDYLEEANKVKDACVIHDMCYETGRDKKLCDDEFNHNFKQLCYESPAAIASYASVGIGAWACLAFPPSCLAVIGGTTAAAIRSALLHCDTVADAAWTAVKLGGSARPLSNSGRDMMQCKKDERLWDYDDDDCNSPGCGS